MEINKINSAKKNKEKKGRRKKLVTQLKDRRPK